MKLPRVEGSDAGPGLNGSRVDAESQIPDGNGQGRARLNDTNANSDASAPIHGAILPVLWNNQYAVLADTEETT